MKKCPYCAEKIQDDAKVCRYCKRDLPLAVEPQAAPAAPVDVDGAAIAAEEAKPRKRSTALLVWLIVISVNFFCVLGSLTWILNKEYNVNLDIYNRMGEDEVTWRIVLLLIFGGVYLLGLIPGWLLWRKKRNKLAFWLSLVILIPTILAPLCFFTVLLG